jgi:integrase
MSQPFDASRSLTTLEQDSTIVAVIEMSQSKWLVAAVVPGIERQPLKRLDADGTITKSARRRSRRNPREESVMPRDSLAKLAADALGSSQLGDLKLAKLTAPMIQAFIDELRATKSPILARKVLVSLKSMLRHAMTRGSVAQNVAASVKVESNNRHQKKLEVGRDIPTPTEIHRLLAVSCRLRPLLVVAVFCGLRASELRGLCWDDVDFDARTITVRQRADAYREMGMPKSEAGQRTIPLAR